MPAGSPFRDESSFIEKFEEELTSDFIQEESTNQLKCEDKPITTNVENGDLQPIYTETWKEVECFDDNLIPSNPFLSNHVATFEDILMDNGKGSADIAVRKAIDITIGLGIIKAFIELGWELPLTGSQIDAQKFMKKFKIIPECFWFTQRGFVMLAEDGYLSRSKSFAHIFKVKKEFPTIEKLNKMIAENFQLYSESCMKEEWQCMMAYLPSLADILVGATSTEDLLLSNNESDFSIEALFLKSHANLQLQKALEFTLEKRYKNNLSMKRPLRILQIYEGGSLYILKFILHSLEKLGMEFEYTLAIKPDTQLAEIASKLKENLDKLIVKPLNIEEDPKDQGFMPDHYDIVIAPFAFTQTKCLKEAFGNVRNILRKTGLLFQMDVAVPTRYFDVSFGTLKSYYKITDADIRPIPYAVTKDIWNHLLVQSGFTTTKISDKTTNKVNILVSEASDETIQYILPLGTRRNYWMVFANTSIICTRTIKTIEQQGRKVFCIYQDETFGGNGDFLVKNNLDVTEQLEEAIDKLESEATAPMVEGVIYFWSHQQSKNVTNTIKVFFHLLQTSLEKSCLASARIYAVLGEETSSVVLDSNGFRTTAPLVGMSKAFKNENPFRFIKTISLNSSENDTCSRLIQNEIWSDDHQVAVLFKGNYKHLPKVVLVENSKQILNSQITPVFKDTGTYVVAGDINSAVFELVQWMIKRNARHIILCGTNETDTWLKEFLTNSNDAGIHIYIEKADVSNMESLKKILSLVKSKGLPPLKGVFHSPRTAASGTILKQNWDSFETSLTQEQASGFNLHIATKDTPLDYFVVLSSAASTFGLPGHVTGSASNAYLQRLVEYRRSLRLPGILITFDQFYYNPKTLNILISEKSITLDTFMLEMAIRTNQSNMMMPNGKICKLKSHNAWLKTYFEEIQETNIELACDGYNFILSSETFWKGLNDCSDGKTRQDFIFKSISEIAVDVLKNSGPTEIASNDNFEKIGIDSLMANELKNKIQSLIGSKLLLTNNTMYECTTLGMLTKEIIDLLFGFKTPLDINSPFYERNKLIREDSSLWPHIKGSQIRFPVSQTKIVLLTGATGFLGPYMLRNLSNRSNITKIYCLIRRSKQSPLAERIEKRCKEMCIYEEIDMSKVEIVQGDVSELGLGIDTDVYEKLSLEVDAVINCAVYANHLNPYRKTVSKHASLRSVNVIGTQNVLEFAATRKTKYVYHASTFLAMWKAEGKRIPEDWPTEGEFDNAPDFGYAISKYIGDRLVAQAVSERNIPCKVFRFPKISGDSRTGRQFVKENHFFMKFIHYITSEFMPNLDIPMQIVPVDVCADVSLELFFMDHVPSDMFNVFNPHSQNEKEITKIASEFGRNVKRVEYGNFVENLEETGEDSLLFPWMDFYTRPDSIFKLHSNGEIPIPVLDVWLQDPENFFAEGKVNKILPHLKETIEKPMDILKRDLHFARDNYSDITL